MPLSKPSADLYHNCYLYAHDSFAAYREEKTTSLSGYYLRKTQRHSGRQPGDFGSLQPDCTTKDYRIKEDRINHWLSVGAQPSATVHNLLVQAGIIADANKKKSVVISQKRQTKLDAKKASDAEAKAQAEVAAQATTAQPEPAADEPQDTSSSQDSDTQTVEDVKEAGEAAAAEPAEKTE